mgnify:CR=1 FL=1
MEKIRNPPTVSVPYEITLLSNGSCFLLSSIIVSVPYEITLLSNSLMSNERIFSVSVPYEITLLSNYPDSSTYDVEFQYLMKLHYSQTIIVYGLGSL